MSVERNGIVNAIRQVLHKSRIGLTTAQIVSMLDVEQYPTSTEQSVKVILSQLKAKKQVRNEKSFCECCLRICTIHYITEEGRMAMSENTGVVDTISLEECINATTRVEHVREEQ